MKKILSSLLLLVFAGTMYAQQEQQAPPPPPKDRPAKTAEQRATDLSNRLEKDLGLSADQKQKVHDLALTKEQKMDALEEKYKGQDRQVWAADRKQVHVDFREGMKKVLTADQFTKWEAMKKDRKPGDDGPPPPPPAPQNK